MMPSEAASWPPSWLWNSVTNLCIYTHINRQHWPNTRLAVSYIAIMYSCLLTFLFQDSTDKFVGPNHQKATNTIHKLLMHYIIINSNTARKFSGKKRLVRLMSYGKPLYSNHLNFSILSYHSFAIKQIAS